LQKMRCTGWSNFILMLFALMQFTEFSIATRNHSCHYSAQRLMISPVEVEETST